MRKVGTKTNILPETTQLLVSGGDVRIALDPLRGVNRYGCAPTADDALLDFGSSTASVISSAAFHCADTLRDRLADELRQCHAPELYRRELARVRTELLDLCELGDLPAPDIVFAASGTDLHRIAARLAQIGTDQPVLAIMVDESETGSGVYSALLQTDPTTEIVTVALRHPDGTPRLTTDIDREFALHAKQAALKGRHVLLIQTDVSKSGMIAPSYGCIATLSRTWTTRLNVLIDACQFRISPATLRACLAQGYSVALTGSKFVGGPSFSGALMIPSQTADRLRESAAFPVGAEWPDTWSTAPTCDTAENFGLLLRWQAALQELRAFRDIPDEDILNFLNSFAVSIRARLTNDPAFSLVSVPTLDRSALMVKQGWDRIQTIFPFRLQRLDANTRRALDMEETLAVYRALPTTRPRCQFGQPVNHGKGINALRICLSARLIVQATSQGATSVAKVIEQAHLAMDQARLLADEVKSSKCHATAPTNVVQMSETCEAKHRIIPLRLVARG